MGSITYHNNPNSIEKKQFNDGLFLILDANTNSLPDTITNFICHNLKNSFINKLEIGNDDFQFSEENNKAILDALYKCNSLSSFKLCHKQDEIFSFDYEDLFTALTRQPLTKLSLNNCGLDESYLTYLFSLLNKKTSLTHVSLTHTFSSQNIKKICEYLQTNKTVKQLSISATKADITVFPSLISLLKQNKTITHFYYDGEIYNREGYKCDKDYYQDRVKVREFLKSLLQTAEENQSLCKISFTTFGLSQEEINEAAIICNMEVNIVDDKCVFTRNNLLFTPTSSPITPSNSVSPPVSLSTPPSRFEPQTKALVDLRPSRMKNVSSSTSTKKSNAVKRRAEGSVDSRPSKRLRVSTSSNEFFSNASAIESRKAATSQTKNSRK